MNREEGGPCSANTAWTRSHTRGCAFPLTSAQRAAQILGVTPAVGGAGGGSWSQWATVSTASYATMWHILLRSSQFSHKFPRKEQLPLFLLLPHLPHQKPSSVSLHPAAWREAPSSNPSQPHPGRPTVNTLTVRVPKSGWSSESLGGSVENVGAWAPDLFHPKLWEKGPGSLYW